MGERDGRTRLRHGDGAQWNQAGALTQLPTLDGTPFAINDAGDPRKIARLIDRRMSNHGWRKRRSNPVASLRRRSLARGI